jgi:hypothetical protein
MDTQIFIVGIDHIVFVSFIIYISSCLLEHTIITLIFSSNSDIYDSFASFKRIIVRTVDAPVLNNMEENYYRWIQIKKIHN